MGPALWLFFPHRSVLQVDPSAYARERLAQTIDIPAEVEKIAEDPLQLRSISMRFALSLKHFRDRSLELADRIHVPTAVLVGDIDPARAGAARFYDGLTVTDKRLVLLPDASHMLFQIRETPAVLQAVIEWIARD